MRLVASSNPNKVDRFEAIDLLVQRAILTRLVCRELMNRTDEGFSRWRTDCSLSFLMQWIKSSLEPGEYFSPSFGIDAMTVPDDCLHLIDEIRDGARVCEALAMLQTADTASDVMNDMMNIEKQLNIYWQRHGTAAMPPALHSLR
mgnify:CR=1 FL=1